MAKEPKFDTLALVKFLEAQGVPHAEAHTKAHAMASEHLCSEEKIDAKDDKLRAEMKIMNAESVTKVFESFDKRTGDLKGEMQEIRHKIDVTRKDLLIWLGSASVGTVVLIVAALEGIRYFFH